MVNTRNNQCNGQPSSNNNNSDHNVNHEQLITTQNQLMQTVLQTLNNMQPNQQAHKQQAPPPPSPHQSRLAEFLQTHPTTFSQAKDPMKAEDWLNGVEKKHMIDKTIVIKSKLKEMEKDEKRNMTFPRQSSESNVRPRFSQPNQFSSHCR
jgi:hypothetical protein